MTRSISDKRVPGAGSPQAARSQAVARKMLAGVKGIHIFWGIVMSISLYFLWSAFSGPQGLVSLGEQKDDASRLELKTRELLEQNHALQKEIYLLNHDAAFIRKVAREELGYVARGEEVYLPQSTSPGPPESAL